MKPTKIWNNKGLKSMLNNIHHLNKDNMHISRSYLILVPPNKKIQYYYLCKDNLKENFTLLSHWLCTNNAFITATLLCLAVCQGPDYTNRLCALFCPLSRGPAVHTQVQLWQWDKVHQIVLSWERGVRRALRPLSGSWATFELRSSPLAT